MSGGILTGLVSALATIIAWCAIPIGIAALIAWLIGRERPRPSPFRDDVTGEVTDAPDVLFHARKDEA